MTAAAIPAFSPLQLAVDSAGHVFVGDFTNDKVYQLNLSGSTWTATTIASQTGGTSGGIAAAAIPGLVPLALGTDTNGHVVVGDFQANSPVELLTLSGSTWSAVTVASQSGGTSGGITAASLPGLTTVGVTMDAGGHIYLNDQSTQSTKQLTLSGSVWSSVDIASRAGGTSGGVTAAAIPSYQVISQLAVDSSGSVYTCDFGNKQVVKLTLSGTTWSGSFFNSFGGSNPFALPQPLAIPK